jgi:hypothetical protein
MADDVRITVIATISTHDALAPPFLIYPGASLLEEWFNVRDPTPLQMGRVTDTGYINNFIAIDWLKTCFDHYTKERAGRSRRLLFLDGHNSHVNMEFIETAWNLGIVCIVFPAHLSAVFQPLDLDFFGPLKARYGRLVSDYQLGSAASRGVKGMFYRWHQLAWAETATSRQICGAWRKTGLYPLDRAVMRAESPEAYDISIQQHPHTPQSTRML